MTVDANNKARSIYGTSGIGSFGAGAAYDFTYPGETGATATDYRAAAGFPRTSTSRWGFEGFSRAKNIFKSQGCFRIIHGFPFMVKTPAFNWGLFFNSPRPSTKRESHKS